MGFIDFMKRKFFCFFIFSFFFVCNICSIFPQVLQSTSTVDWTQNLFLSSVQLDTQKANIPMPSGKSTAINKIALNLPILLKDPLLSLQVDSSNSLGDLVIRGSVTLEALTKIVDKSKRTPGVFKKNTSILCTEHTLNLKEIGSKLVKHTAPVNVKVLLQNVSSKPWTGIVIDARGALPVHGEYVQSSVYPCFFPKIWCSDMTLVYEKNIISPQTAKQNAIVKYDFSSDESRYKDRVGNNPLHIKAVQVYGAKRCDPVIPHTDTLKILSVSENRKLLQEGKVVILLDKDNLIHPVAAPEKTKKYYTDYKNLLDFLYINKVPDVVAVDSPSGIRILISDLKFIADSSVLLPQEKPRLSKITQSLKQITQENDYSILVEGHTADVNKPEGQMLLSIQRAQAIIQSLVAGGLSQDMFTYKGYGGTVPLADNDTEAGRAQNRRVEILILPKSTYTQKIW